MKKMNTGLQQVLWGLIVWMIWLRQVIASFKPGHVFDINDTIAYLFMAVGLVLIVLGIVKLAKKK